MKRREEMIMNDFLTEKNKKAGILGKLKWVLCGFCILFSLGAIGASEKYIGEGRWGMAATEVILGLLFLYPTFRGIRKALKKKKAGEIAIWFESYAQNTVSFEKLEQEMGKGAVKKLEKFIAGGYIRNIQVDREGEFIMITAPNRRVNEKIYMALNKVEICGVNTSTLPVLKQEEKEELFKRIKAGDNEARELYIKGNLRLVLSVIRRFQNSSENPDDLFQIGCIGLIKAIDNFDTTLQVKFSTYAVPMIIGEIRRYLRDNNSIRVSRSLRDIAYKTIYTRENYMRQHLKEPTIAEIAQEIGIDKEMIVYAMDAIQSPVSLFEPVYSEGGDTLYVMDQISDKKNREEHWIEDISLRDAISRLGERERHIIDLRFYEGKTQMEVAEEIGISQAQVSRLEKNALRCMRNYLRN